MDQRKTVVCCLDASTWTRTVAWFHIVWNLGGTVVSTYVVHFFGHILVPSANMQLIGISMVFILGFVVSILLLVGSVQRIPHYIKAWLVFNAGTTAVLFALVVLIAVQTGGSGLVLMALLIPNMFSLYVTLAHLVDVGSQKSLSGSKRSEESKKKGIAYDSRCIDAYC